ncbi:MAG: hypothetical protein COW24_04355 [Candidatus Kerfeldbacteria bacterium CG15_BIG_FIL_POST_REV_8_21_14_020_45_12]|uniref:Uncharacterized protein n=1 Tax=Candidatus Kerfeldbacteria bacterium CG15_BIG_FIL_POST_REV_8_21_14_020_45_12 TaxID=2014247 RepID=A0A2M7H300_9BACT|nr:MAG: hypothetical protein COW24_04355 [Candidatus Kerfeldbacteria bacterium CG15_BIG_FIL_POST_REV_8_21_14_020_45_12]PJA93393.1 MAG: hypothetical protein CO132_03490 [Candidatus Kerfeldbacteria bacterium CG_4_9_14_3_um_filter_45_8]
MAIKKSFSKTCDCKDMSLGVIATALVLFVLIYGWVALVGPEVLSGDNEGQQWSTLLEVDAGVPQAVFLTNGQVYFGNITGASSDVLKMENVHYLQANNTDTATTDESGDEEGDVSDATDTGLSLIELGTTEVHSPTNLLMVQRDQILYWENLTPDSEVTKAMQ